VRVFVPARSNHLVADLVAGPSLRDLEVEGVKVVRYRGMIHAKTILVDGPAEGGTSRSVDGTGRESLAVVGSANFDMRSLFLDYEIALFFSGPAEVAWLSGWFEATGKQCDPGAPKAGWVRTRVEAVARLLAPLV
jgi:cardiolipin synthase A/B